MFADLALHIPNLPKTPGCHSLGVGGKSATKLSKILLFLRYKAKSDPRHRSDQSRLDPEPRRTPAPRMGPVRVSRNSQNSSVRAYVNEDPQIFCEDAWNFTATQAKTGSWMIGQGRTPN